MASEFVNNQANKFDKLELVFLRYSQQKTGLQQGLMPAVRMLLSSGVIYSLAIANQSVLLKTELLDLGCI